MMDVKDFLANDRFARDMGIVLTEVADGRAKASLRITDDHLNAAGMAQGGAIFTLADLVLAAASNSYGDLAVTLNVNISFIKATPKGVLYAEASETSRGKRIATYTMNITNESGELIATAQGMAYRKGITNQNLSQP